MHCVAIGVMKMLMHLWLDYSNKAEDFFIGNKLSIINDRLLQMTPPYFVTRAPRLLQDLCNWKASEFRTFLLFYSVPCLYGILPDEHFQLLLCLNQAIYILMQTSISLADLKTAQNMLCKFCASIDFLYGKRYERSNVHGLLHLTRKVKDLGPLWAHSCFFYEDLNGDLRSLFHGIQKIALQISSAVLIHQHIPFLANCLKPGTSAADIYFLMTNKYLTKSKYISSEIYAIGSFNACILSDHLLKELGVERDIIMSAQKFYKLIKDYRVYHSKGYMRVMVRDSCTIRYFCDDQINYGQIQYFLKVESRIATEHYAVIYKLYPVKSNMLLPVHMEEVKLTENSGLVAVRNILDHCMLMKMRDQCLVASFPNVLEKDQFAIVFC